MPKSIEAIIEEIRETVERCKSEARDIHNILYKSPFPLSKTVRVIRQTEFVEMKKCEKAQSMRLETLRAIQRGETISRGDYDFLMQVEALKDEPCLISYSNINEALTSIPSPERTAWFF